MGQCLPGVVAVGQYLPIVVGCGSVFTYCGWLWVSIYLLWLVVGQSLPAGAGCGSVFTYCGWLWVSVYPSSIAEGQC